VKIIAAIDNELRKVAGLGRFDYVQGKTWYGKGYCLENLISSFASDAIPLSDMRYRIGK
jgi:hypothetical protein